MAISSSNNQPPGSLGFYPNRSNKMKKILIATAMMFAASASVQVAQASQIALTVACGDNIAQVAVSGSDISGLIINDTPTDFANIRHLAKNGTAITEVVGYNQDGSGWIVRESMGMHSLTPAHWDDITKPFVNKPGRVVLCGRN